MLDGSSQFVKVLAYWYPEEKRLKESNILPCQVLLGSRSVQNSRICGYNLSSWPEIQINRTYAKRYGNSKILYLPQCTFPSKFY